MKRFYCFLVAAILFCACSEDWKNGKRLGEKPVLFPDYAQTTIPYNIAPLNFTVRADGCRVSVLLEAGVVKFKVEAPDGIGCDRLRCGAPYVFVCARTRFAVKF